MIHQKAFACIFSGLNHFVGASIINVNYHRNPADAAWILHRIYFADCWKLDSNRN